MRSYLLAPVATLLWFVADAPSQGSQDAREQAFRAQIKPFVTQYCQGCHNAKMKTGGIAVDGFTSVSDLLSHTGDWEQIVRKVRTGEMPPKGLPRAKEADTHAFVSWIETELDRSAAEKPDPGRVGIHRLNRAEYNNAVRDLLAVDFTPGDDFPADDAGYGFDNIADVLSLPPVLMEKYMNAAGKVSRIAVGNIKVDPSLERMSADRRIPQRERIADELPLGTRGGLLITHRFPVEGEYLLRTRLTGDAKGVLPPMLEFRVDGKRVSQTPAQVRLEEENEEGRRIETKVRIPAGKHDIAVTFLRESTKTEDTEAAVNERGRPIVRQLTVDWIEIGGPFNVTGPGDTPSRRLIFSCKATVPAEQDSCASTILSRLARKAYRRPVTSAEVASLMKFFRMGKEDAGNFDSGIQLALKAMLVSPNFLFRVERDPKTGSAPHQVSDVELASRLSFFLWSSIPDDELLDLAEKGQLRKNLDPQIKRMLADRKSRALVDNFAGQWLHLRNLMLVKPDPEKFPEFDMELRQAAKRETEMFVENVIREDRSVLDFLDGKYTFLNERLAKHYGIEGVKGRNFRKVPLDGEQRSGVLTQASVLTVSSYPTRTSPVIRGKWILENLLGAPPPAPPPGVPELKENEIGQSASLRQQLEQHRSNAACAGCHARMDVIGFALETYDAVGKWRTKDGKFPIDPSGTLPNGTAIAGSKDLKTALVAQKAEFVNALTEKMLTYALGRGLERYDKPVVRSISREAANGEYKFSALVQGIVNSTPFQYRRPAATTVSQTEQRASVK
jgi:mono/diheme cytochrome c family protein